MDMNNKNEESITLKGNKIARLKDIPRTPIAPRTYAEKRYAVVIAESTSSQWYHLCKRMAVNMV